MNTDKLNNWLSLLANLAVVVGIIALVAEINQNTQATRLSSYQDLVGRIVEINQLTLENESVRRLVNELGFLTPACARTANPDIQLDAEDLAGVNGLLFIWMRHADMAYFQYQSGAISYERLISATAPLINLLNVPLVVSRWNLVKPNFVPEFQDFIDGQMIEIQQRCGQL